MLKIITIFLTLMTSGFALANTQNCSGGGGKWHIKSRGITVLGPVSVTFKNRHGTWIGSGNWGSSRRMTISKMIDRKMQTRRFYCWSDTTYRIVTWECKEKGTRKTFSFKCHGGDWYPRYP